MTEYIFNTAFASFDPTTGAPVGFNSKMPFGSPATRTLPGNGDCEWFSDLTDTEAGNVNPFSAAPGGGLAIKMDKPPAGITLPQGTTVTSGCLTTVGKFKFTYGRVGMRCKFPKVKGLGSIGLYMIKSDDPDLWIESLDVIERVVGQNGEVAPFNVDMNINYGDYDNTNQFPIWNNTFLQSTLNFDPAADFHNYEADITPTTITQYIDGAMVASGPTPPINTQMNNLVLVFPGGGGWPGPIDMSALPCSLIVRSMWVKKNAFTTASNWSNS